MKFNKLMYWLGLRPLTVDIIADEYAILTKKKAGVKFKTIVEDLISYGNTQCVCVPDVGKELIVLLRKANIDYQSKEVNHGYTELLFLIDIRNAV